MAIPCCSNGPTVRETAADLVGERVLIEQQQGTEMSAALKRLDRGDGAYVLRSDNPDFDAIPATCRCASSPAFCDVSTRLK